MARRPAAVGVLRDLGGMPLAHFLRDYWQRRPLLIRQAFPGIRTPVGRERLFALAAREDVESRLVTRQGRRWRLAQGPIARRDLPSPTERRWTLLVQGLEGVDARARALLDRFRFLPDARLDDLMASYATDGGGVGPHVDQYDVFLLQVHGRRRWRIGRQRDLALDERQPLRLLKSFRPTREWLLEPGDMLYLPPGVAHDGVADGECITCSIGFRAPAWQEILDPWFAHFAERAALRGRYGERSPPVADRPAQLPARLVREAHRRLSARRPGRKDTERFLLEYLSEPKQQVVFRRRSALPAAVVRRRARSRGIALDTRSRLLLGRGMAALNGEAFDAGSRTLRLLDELATNHRLRGERLRTAPAELLERIGGWYAAGWIRFDRTA